MAHEIREHDKVLSVREYTWHGLETYSDEYIPAADVRKMVHNYDVVREPVYRKVVTVQDGEPHEEFVLVEDQEFNVRTDTDEILSSVPTDRVDINIDEMYDIAELLQGENKNVLIETAGSLRNGRDAFILIRLDQPIEVKGDPNGLSLPFAALQNSWEVGAAFRLQPTNVRIVCKNTSRMADVSAEHTGFQQTFAHTKNMRERLEEAKSALAGWYDDIQAWARAKEVLAAEKVTVQQVNWFVNTFIEEPHTALTSDRVKANIEEARTELIGEIFNRMTEGIELTSLGLFEGASSWNEHIRRAQSPFSRFKRSLLEPTNVLAQARDLALEAATV